MISIHQAARILTRLVIKDSLKKSFSTQVPIQIHRINFQAFKSRSANGLTFASLRSYSKPVEAEDVEAETPDEVGGSGAGDGARMLEQQRDPEKDRTKEIPVETSLEYMKSDAYKQTYGDTPVWVLYRRNFKGQFAPKKTRKTCIRNGMVVTGNPCPICRDEYLVLDYRNVPLLKQFISPFNGEVLHWDKTGVCRRQQFHLLKTIQKAKDYGTITFDVKFREYNYEDYYSKEQLDKLKAENIEDVELLEQKSP